MTVFSFPSSYLMWCLYATLNPSSSPSPIFLKLRTWIETSVCLGLTVGVYNPSCVVVVQLLSRVQLFLNLWTVALPCPSLSPEACSNSFPLSQWCHPTISSSVASFSSCSQSFLASESFPSNESVFHIRWPNYWSIKMENNPWISQRLDHEKFCHL